MSADTQDARAGDRFGAEGLGRMAKQLALPAMILAALVAGTAISPVFLTAGNLLNVATSMSITGIVVVAMTFVLVSGGLADLSVPATIATGAILSLALQPIVGVPLAVILAIAAATAAGCVNGVLVGYVRVNPIIATLGTGAIILGLAQWSVGGVIVYGTDPVSADFVKSSLLGVPMVVVLFAGFALLGHVLMSHSVWGRWTLATGGNYAAARASAVPVRLVKAGAFALTGLASGVSGVLLGLTLQAARPEIGAGYEFASITAVVVGGISIAGGFGSVPRAIGGLVFVALLTNLMVLLGVRTPVQGLALGALMSVAVAADVLLRGRAR